jgi:hypothetical protein
MDGIQDYCIDTLCADYLMTNLNAMLRRLAFTGTSNPIKQKKQC